MNETRNSITDIWGPRTPYKGDWPERIDQRILEEPDRWVQSTCVLCSNGCALDIGVKNGKIVGVRGTGVDPVNHGRLGPKGLHGWEANNSTDRLTHPLIWRNDKLVKVTWETAMDLIVQRSKEVMNRCTGNAIGFYNTGQLFLEEYYTLSMIGDAGIHTPHMDGNTRLCTASAAMALIESFGTDGDPGTYADIDTTDAIFHVGHNPANTQTVLWMRILDRLHSTDRPKLIVVDPRKTDTAREADVHIAPRLGTNVPVLNGLLNLIIQKGYSNRDFIEAHTVGFDTLAGMTAKWSPERVEAVTGVPIKTLQAAAEILGTTPTLVSTVLQGVYQSWQATAAAVQVNNVHLIRGMIGKPGCTVFQMNGQPTAQNTRECGANGELVAFRNWNNPAHIAEQARIWNVRPEDIPHANPPSHAMQIFRYAETGSIKLLWIIGTNPAVTLPELARIRRILQKKDLFVIVQDGFLSETAALADIVLPAAIWGEKTGCFTNADRTVHISHKAIEPPGEARSDLDIFLDYAQRMDFRDKDGAPLIKWNDPESAFEAWKKCSKGRPCDYSALTYDKLTNRSGIKWPCNFDNPGGADRLYTNGIFHTSFDYCETYGHDLITGAAITPEQYKANDPGGKAIIKCADYIPPEEQPDENYPLWLTTGRVVYHWHTRTKTGRSRELSDAAPDVYIQISHEDALRYKISNGDVVEVESRRGKIYGHAHLGDIIPGHVFIPFHYGYWDNPEYPRAVNELTITSWDPVSKQPHFKYAAVRIHKSDETALKGKMGGMTKGLVKEMRGVVEKVRDAITGETTKAHVAEYLELLRSSEQEFINASRKIRTDHPDEHDVVSMSRLMISWSEKHLQALSPFIERYTGKKSREPKKHDTKRFYGTRTGSIGLLRDLHDLSVLASDIEMCWIILSLAAKQLIDKRLEDVCNEFILETERQIDWLKTRIRHTAPQVLIVG
ncbi:MAG: nitrate reductase [wastewater metagenome]|nr:nitrate reductase [Candidatus Loosdrechtia aerotolerans]